MATMTEQKAGQNMAHGVGQGVGHGVAQGTMSDKKWYVIHVQPGFEKKVREAIEEEAKRKNQAAAIEEILIPTEDVTEIKRNKKIKTERKFFPGYILIKMAMTDSTWNLVRYTNRVTGFLGAGKKPVPISDREAQRILSQVKEGVERPRPSVQFQVGEMVVVVDGPFASFQGLVEEIDEEKSRLKVMVTIFGRETPVDLDYGQVEKSTS